MGIVSYGVANLPPTNSEGLESKVIPYVWNSGFGYEIRQDNIIFGVFSVLTKISSSFPVRIRLYQDLDQQALDINRPPWVLANAQTKPLADVLVGQGVENTIVLNPVSLIVDVTQVPITIEKLLPNGATINLLIYVVG